MTEDAFRNELRRMARENGIPFIKEDKIIEVVRGDVNAGAGFVNIFRGSERSDLLLVTSAATHFIKDKMFSVRLVWSLRHDELRAVRPKRHTFSGYVIDDLELTGAESMREFRFGFNRPDYETQTRREIAVHNCQIAADQISDVSEKTHDTPDRSDEVIASAGPAAAFEESGQSDAEWLAAGERRYGSLVKQHYGSPETIAAGGHKQYARGDVAAALFFFQKAIDLLHTNYDFMDMSRRRPDDGDRPIIDSYINTLGDVRRRRPAAPVSASVREVTHRLRTISTACRSAGIDPGLYLDALKRIGAAAPDIDVSDIVW